MNYANRLKKAREWAKMSQADLSSASEVSQQIISRLETGQQKSSRSTVNLANAMGISANWLGTGSGTMTSSPNITEPSSHREIHEIPFYSWENINTGLTESTEPERWIPTSETSNLRLISTNMVGLSMASLALPSIPSGATITIEVNEQIPAKLPAIVIARVNGDITCRQLTKEAGQYLLEPLNKDYKHTAFNPETDQILGTALQISTM